jgi:hypothetical protein
MAGACSGARAMIAKPDSPSPACCESGGCGSSSHSAKAEVQGTVESQATTGVAIWAGESGVRTRLYGRYAVSSSPSARLSSQPQSWVILEVPTAVPFSVSATIRRSTVEESISVSRSPANALARSTTRNKTRRTSSRRSRSLPAQSLWFYTWCGKSPKQPIDLAEMHGG